MIDVDREHDAILLEASHQNARVDAELSTIARFDIAERRKDGDPLRRFAGKGEGERVETEIRGLRSGLHDVQNHASAEAIAR
ncbi:hypothetical protein [Methylosinus sp. Sm6]|uniref:hypothetical protein n=1 Tax=Methylosinus sp. Sm6 TaxID=2866948 RepID=UPI00351D969E